MSTTPPELEKQAAKRVQPEGYIAAQWKPGQSGNPKGRPKKEHTLTSLLRDELALIDTNTGLTYEQLLARAMVRGGIAAAVKGNDSLARTILERLEGKVPDLVDLRAVAVVMAKPVEQMSLEELEAYDRELQALAMKYAPMGLPTLLREGDDTGSSGPVS